MHAQHKVTVAGQQDTASPVRTVGKWYSLWPLIDVAQFGQQAKEAAILDLLQTEISAAYFNSFKIDGSNVSQPLQTFTSEWWNNGKIIPISTLKTWNHPSEGLGSLQQTNSD